MNDPAPASLGLRAHSGWAAMVAIAGPATGPYLVSRRRIGLVATGSQETSQPYHAAVRLELEEAREFIRVYADRARAMAIESLSAVIADLRREGCEVAGCGVLLSSGRPTNDLARTLASHALIHTAEGHLFRNALVEAAEHCGLAVTAVRQRELFSAAETALGIDAGGLRSRIADMGRSAGPPWREDEKYSALVAWIALAAGVSDYGRSVQHGRHKDE